MGKGEWVAVLGIVATLLTAGLTGWVANESRIATLEQDIEILNTSKDILIDQVLTLTKEVHELKGMHMEHVKNTIATNERE